MDVVLYTEDFEPITVIPLTIRPEQIERYMGGRYRIPVPEFLPRELYAGTAFNDVLYARILTIRVEPLIWKDGSRKFVLIAEDDVLALKLRPSWLPGQRGTVNDYRQAINNLAALLVQAMGGE